MLNHVILEIYCNTHMHVMLYVLDALFVHILYIHQRICIIAYVLKVLHWYIKHTANAATKINT